MDTFHNSEKTRKKNSTNFFQFFFFRFFINSSNHLKRMWNNKKSDFLWHMFFSHLLEQCWILLEGGGWVGGVHVTLHLSYLDQNMMLNYIWCLKISFVDCLIKNADCQSYNIVELLWQIFKPIGDMTAVETIWRLLKC